MPSAKGRLSGALSLEERARLAAVMLARAIAAVRSADDVDGLLVVATEGTDLPGDVERLADPGEGLNPAIAAARDLLIARGASRVVSLAADLPQITPDDVTALCTLPEGMAAIAPDKHGTGTNALSLPLPAASAFTYGYGEGSCARHKAEAARLGIAMTELHRSGLARDVDEPDDLPDAKALMGD